MYYTLTTINNKYNNKTMNKNVIILVGAGKSTLTNFFLEDNSRGFETIYPSLRGLKPLEVIKIKRERDTRFIIHLEDMETYNKMEAGIKRRAWLFNLSK